MSYTNGSLEVTQPDTDFVFAIEIGQGAKEIVCTTDDLSEAIEQMLRQNYPQDFRQALQELQELGQKHDWDWQKISDSSPE